MRDNFNGFMIGEKSSRHQAGVTVLSMRRGTTLLQICRLFADGSKGDSVSARLYSLLLSSINEDELGIRVELAGIKKMTYFERHLERRQSPAE